MVKLTTKNNRNYGGARDNAGRRPMNHAFGTPAQRQSNQTRIESFFSSARRQIGLPPPTPTDQQNEKQTIIIFK